MITCLISYRRLLLLNLFAFPLPTLYSTLSNLWFANISSLTTDGYTSHFGASSIQHTATNQFCPSSGEQTLGNMTYWEYWASRQDTTSTDNNVLVVR